MTKTLLCFGDSNTNGTKPLKELGVFARYDRSIRWPGKLAGLLGAKWHVIEEGHPGRTTLLDDPIEGPHRNGLTVLPSILESHRPIDLIILKLGTNDLKPRFPMTAHDISLAIEKLISVIQSSGCGVDGNAPEILLVAPVPITVEGTLKLVFEGAGEKSRQLAHFYELSADKLGCAFFDAGTVAKTDPIDGVHLNEEAHHAIAHALFSKIESNFP